MISTNTCSLTCLHIRWHCSAEILQLINLVPSSAVEIHLIVESCEERLSGEKVEELLGLIARQLRPCRVPDKT